MPKGIQFKRHQKLPPNTVYVGRPSKWGNPYKVWQERGRWWVGCWPYVYKTLWPTKEVANGEAVQLYKKWFKKSKLIRLIKELRGKNLACWCALDLPCHRNFLLEIANG